VSNGPNEPVSPQQLEKAFDPQDLDQAARQAGTDRGSLLQELSRMLPHMVDRMTPQGRLPAEGEPADHGGFQDMLDELAPGQNPGGKEAGRQGGPKDPI
jgi:hypothetical protein